MNQETIINRRFESVSIQARETARAEIHPVRFFKRNGPATIALSPEDMLRFSARELVAILAGCAEPIEGVASHMVSKVGHNR